MLTSVCFADESKKSFCDSRKDVSAIAQMLRQDGNLLTLQNQQGLFGFNTGVCWWHSRLQRRFSYLANFKPELPRVDEEGVKRILRKIKRGNEIVEIPGYSDLAEFSNNHADLIQKSLNAWIFGDSFTRQRWIKGLKGSTTLEPEKMTSHLEKMYKQFKEADGLMMQVLQMKGIAAHAWLIVGMTKATDNSYFLEIVDSNFPSRTWTYTIKEGDNSMDSWGFYDDFIGYTEFKKELNKLKKIVERYCSES